jgi:hypothetical protein
MTGGGGLVQRFCENLRLNEMGGPFKLCLSGVHLEFFPAAG